MTARRLPRGIRNHNPGNIRHTRPATPWQGIAADQLDGAFVSFAAPAWGIRALARTLITYQDKHGLRTVRDLIYRWAPPVENDTESYVAAVSAALGVYPEAEIDVTQHAVMLPLCQAIALHENGSGKAYGRPVYWYDADTWDEGLRRAGVVRKPKAALADPDVHAAGAAGLGGAITLADATGIAKQFVEPGSIAAQVAGVLAVAAAAYLLWRILRKRRAGS